MAEQPRLVRMPVELLAEVVHSNLPRPQLIGERLRGSMRLGRGELLVAP